jgi:acyl carrier protein
MQFLAAEPVLDTPGIEQNLRTYWEAFHLKQDGAGRLLRRSITPAQLSRVVSVDYFRYDPASAADVRSYLRDHDPNWKQPKDTGVCSSNCTLNDAGIAVHLRARGYHPYGEALSWDIRFGLLGREEGQRQIGYEPALPPVAGAIRKLKARASHDQLRFRDAVVLSRDDDTLVAFVCADWTVDAHTIRRYLKERIPEYMVPNEFVQVDEIPLNASGKVDRDALLQMRAPERPIGKEDRATTQRLRAIWAEILGHSPDSVDEDFFEAGGTSLKATILAVAIEDVFGVSIPIAAAIEFPTIRQQVELVEQRARIQGVEHAPANRSSN